MNHSRKGRRFMFMLKKMKKKYYHEGAYDRIIIMMRRFVSIIFQCLLTTHFLIFTVSVYFLWYLIRLNDQIPRWRKIYTRVFSKQTAKLRRWESDTLNWGQVLASEMIRRIYTTRKDWKLSALLLYELRSCKNMYVTVVFQNDYREKSFHKQTNLFMPPRRWKLYIGSVNVK